jgi:hypothetical protein
MDAPALALIPSRWPSGHRLSDDVGTVLLDAIRERKPRCVPSEVIKEFSVLLRSYNISEIRGDDFAGGFEDEWLRNGIRFIKSDYTTSDNYLRALPIVLAQRARFINNSTLRNQFASLERIVGGGREKVDHPRHAGAHDDVATAVAGMLVVAGNRLGFDHTYRWLDDTPPAPPASGDTQQHREAAAWRHQQFDNYLRGLMYPGLNPMTGRPSSIWDHLPGRRMVWR